MGWNKVRRNALHRRQPDSQHRATMAHAREKNAAILCPPRGTSRRKTRGGTNKEPHRVVQNAFFERTACTRIPAAASKQASLQCTACERFAAFVVLVETNKAREPSRSGRMDLENISPVFEPQRRRSTLTSWGFPLSCTIAVPELQRLRIAATSKNMSMSKSKYTDEHEDRRQPTIDAALHSTRRLPRTRSKSTPLLFRHMYSWSEINVTGVSYEQMLRNLSHEQSKVGQATVLPPER